MNRPVPVVLLVLLILLLVATIRLNVLIAALIITAESQAKYCKYCLCTPTFKLDYSPVYILIITLLRLKENSGSKFWQVKHYSDPGKHVFKYGKCVIGK